MSDTMILDAVKAFLKPIIAEAIHEAGNTNDTDSLIVPTADALTADAFAAVQPSTDQAVAEGDAEAKRRELLSKYYTVDEIKAILHIGTTSVYNLFKKKKLTKLKVLGKTVVLRSELDNAVETQEVARYSHRK